MPIPTDDLICLVDDDKSVLRAVNRLLLANGLHARAFSSPLEFIEYAKCHAVPVAILDVNMLEMSGIEVFAWLRKISLKSRVIFISGASNAATCTLVMQQGAEAFFSKPFINEAFVSTVQEALSHSGT